VLLKGQCVEGLNCKRTIPICRLFFKIDLLTDIAAFYRLEIHSLVCIIDPACELLPPWTKELCILVLCRPYSAGILHSVSDQMQNLPNYFTTPNKMTSENDIKGLVSLKILRPRNSATRFLTSGFFHESDSPKPLFSKIW
jgi:hypothetical protein